MSRLINTPFGGKCANCGCPIEVNSKVMFTPPTVPGTTLGKKIVHAYDCGTTFVVRSLYRSTAATDKVAAFNPLTALQVVFAKRNRQVVGGREVPWRYVVATAAGVVITSWDPEGQASVPDDTFVDAHRGPKLVAKMPPPAAAY